MILKTYNEWLELGYHVIRGSRHVSRDENNRCLFSDEQVVDDDGDYYNDRWDTAPPRACTRSGISTDPSDYDYDHDDPTIWDNFGDWGYK